MLNDEMRQMPLERITSKIGSGATPRGGKESYKQKGVSLIRSMNVHDLYFERSGLAFIDDVQAGELSNVKVESGDILINITGASVARCCIVPSDILPARVNQHVAIVRPINSIVDGRFIQYCLVSPRYKDLLLNIASAGATREALTKTTLERLEIEVPSLETQRRIAGILSAYDDLIENNTRRIRLLEEMARALYREWFVHYRFPGHQNVAMVEHDDLGAVPEGWEVLPLKKVARINRKSIKKGNAPESIDYVNITSVSTGSIDEVEPMLFADAPSRARRRVEHGDIIWSTVRPNRESYAVVMHPQDNLIVSTGFAVISPEKVPYTFLYHAATEADFVGYLTNRATGAAYPAVTSTIVKDAPILAPPSELAERFHTTAELIFELKYNLLQKNHNLRQTRDLLLARLVSGEIPVEAAEKELEEAA